MNIQSEVKQQIANLANSGSEEKQQVHIVWPAGEMDIALHAVQSLGCSMWQLDVRPSLHDPIDHELLGQRIADQVQYLLEPLQVHERDTERRAMQMRSWPPHREDRTVRYYEVSVMPDDRLRLGRYEKQPASTRQQIPTVLTVEVLAQLCHDVARLTTAGSE